MENEGLKAYFRKPVAREEGGPFRPDFTKKSIHRLKLNNFIRNHTRKQM